MHGDRTRPSNSTAETRFFSLRYIPAGRSRHRRQSSWLTSETTGADTPSKPRYLGLTHGNPGAGEIALARGEVQRVCAGCSRQRSHSERKKGLNSTLWAGAVGNFRTDHFPIVKGQFVKSKYISVKTVHFDEFPRQQNTQTKNDSLTSSQADIFRT